MRKTRTHIPKDTAVTVLFKADHCCCICRNKSAGVTIHHLDEDPSNNHEDNLVALCPNDQAKVHTKSNMVRAYSTEEVLRYKSAWEETVRIIRAALEKPSQARIVKFDGEDKQTIYLEVDDNRIRGFTDPATFRLMGFKWGNVDIYPEEAQTEFSIEPPLQSIHECEEIRLKFKDETLAPEIFVVWEGRRHHIPNPPTLAYIQGVDHTNKIDWGRIKQLNLEKFNAIPKGSPVFSIFDFTLPTSDGGQSVVELTW